MSIRVPSLRRIGAALTVLAAVAATAFIAAPARAADDGYVRLAHLSPDTPDVDVYLKAQSGDGKTQKFPGVGYGVMSPYLRLPVGTYSVAMRPAGAAESTDPVLTTQVDVAAGQAYTVAGVGRYADLGLRVLKDNLALPDPNESKVRIIQASVRAPVLNVGIQGGATIANGVQFATTTSYREVKPGAWTLKVQPTGGGLTRSLPVKLGAGNVYSLLVLDAKGGGLHTQLRIDAQRQGAVPNGAVATGDGGSQPASHLPMALLLAGIAALLAGGTVVVIRRRPQLA